MTRYLIVLALLLCLGSLHSPARGASATPHPSAPGPKDKCPVCGMFVKKYPSWVATVAFKDGSHAWFDGAKDLFTYLGTPQRYTPGRTAAMVDRLWVKDYYSLQPIDAKTAYYVIGSKVYGPMGHELIPFKRLDDAREFMLDHQGTQIIRYGDVTPTLLKTLE